MANKKDTSNVSVAVRIRPRNEKEITAGMPVFFSPSADGAAVQELDENGQVLKNWAYDSVFGPECGNKDIFDTMALKLVDAAMEGYNTVVFMYGQTSSGKTFTLFGGGNTVGVVQLAMEHVHDRVTNSQDMEYVIKLTYAELYNEEIKDLLSATPNENLKIIDDPQLGPLIQNITEASFTTAADMKQLLDEGENRRHFGVTNMNAHSSRSHVIVRLNIESRKVSTRPQHALRAHWGKDRPNCVSTLNLVDLAGSERASKSGTSGQSLKEGSYINRSLLTLGTVISNLSEGKLQHIPYRNSKLTRLLATALGGNAKTCVVCCISPASGNLAESLNTLRFASRAKRVVNHVQRNEIMDLKTLTGKLTLQSAEIDHLRHLLEQSRLLGFHPEEDDQGESLREQAVEATRKWRGLRFLVRRGPAIVQALRAEGLTQLAKKVSQELREAVAGSRDVHDVVDGLSDVIVTYLPKHRRLLQRIHAVQQAGQDTEIITMRGEGPGGETEGSGGESDGSEDDLSAMGGGGRGTKRKGGEGLVLCGGDLFVDLDGEEVRELLEGAQLHTEEVRSQASASLSSLQQEVAALQSREKVLRQAVDAATSRWEETREALRQSRQTETSLSKQLEDCQEHRRVDAAQASETILSLTDKLGQLEVHLAAQHEALGARQYDLLARESDLDKLRYQADQLTKELAAALASRKALEEETARLRTDMRLQMDRLRLNMHEMLTQGGEEVRLLQEQNQDLSKQLDDARDVLNETEATQAAREIELSRIRAELALAAAEEKLRQEEITVLKDENAGLSLKVRELVADVARLTSSLSFSEAQTSQLQASLQVQAQSSAEALDARDQDLDALRDRLRLRQQELQTALDRSEVDLASALADLQTRQTHWQRVEAALQADLQRAEKKLAGQTARVEELHKENTSLGISLHAVHFKHQVKLKAQTARTAELQATLDAINAFVERQQKESAEAQESEATGGSAGGPYYYYTDDVDVYYHDSPLTRQGSVRLRRGLSLSGDMMLPGQGLSPYSAGGGNNNSSAYQLSPYLGGGGGGSYYRPSLCSVGSTPGAGTTGGGGEDFDFPLVEVVTLPSERGKAKKDKKKTKKDKRKDKKGRGKGRGERQAGRKKGGEAAERVERRPALRRDAAASFASPPLASPTPSILSKKTAGDSHHPHTPSTPALTPRKVHYALGEPSASSEGEGKEEEEEEEEEGEEDDDWSSSSSSSSSCSSSSTTSSSSSPSNWEDVVEQHSAALSASSSRLLYGLQWATLLMDHALQEQVCLRTALLQQRQDHSDRALEDRGAWQRLQTQHDHLAACNDQLTASLQHALDRAAALETRVQAEEAAHCAVVKDLHRVSKAEKLAAAQAARYEQLYLDGRVQLDKARLDLQRCQQEKAELRLEKLVVAGQVEQAEEKQAALREQLEVCRQQLDLLQREREALMARLLQPAATSPASRLATGPLPR